MNFAEYWLYSNHGAVFLYLHKFNDKRIYGLKNKSITEKAIFLFVYMILPALIA
jgi:hypothetical protein